MPSSSLTLEKAFSTVINRIEIGKVELSGLIGIFGLVQDMLFYDALTAHVAIVFTRYMILALGSRESKDERSIGALFINVVDEMADITLMEALTLLLQLFAPPLKEYAELSEERISELLDKFIESLPPVLKKVLQAA